MKKWMCFCWTNKRQWSAVLSFLMLMGTAPALMFAADSGLNLLSDPVPPSSPAIDASKVVTSSEPELPAVEGDEGLPTGPLSSASIQAESAFYDYGKRLQIAKDFRNEIYQLIGRNPAADETKWDAIFRDIVGDPAQPNANAPLPTFRRLQAAVKHNMNTMYRVEIERAMHLGPVPNASRTPEDQYHLYLFYNLEMDQLGTVPKGPASETRFQEFNQYIREAGIENAIVDFYMHDTEVIERNLRDRAQQFGIPELGSPETGQPRLSELMSITYVSGNSRSLYGKNLSLTYRAIYRQEIADMIKQAKFNIYSCLVPIKLFLSKVDLGLSPLSGQALMDQVDQVWRAQFHTAGERFTMVQGFTDLLDAIITGNLALVNGHLEPARTRTPQILQILASRGIDFSTEPSFIRIAQEITDIIMNGTEIENGTHKQISENFSTYELNLDVQDFAAFPTDRREASDPDHAHFLELVHQRLTGQITAAQAAATLYLQRENQLRAMYVEVFGRAASETEVAYYAKKPSLPLSLLRQGLFNSREGQIVAMYRVHLNRQPAPEEVGHWLNWLMSNPNGLPAIEIGLRNQGQLFSMYRNILHREPAPEEINHWLNWLNSNPNGLPAIEIGLRNSQEGQLVAVYWRTLGRQPAPTEIAHWRNWLAMNPYGLPAIEIGLSSSPEARNRAIR